MFEASDRKISLEAIQIPTDAGPQITEQRLKYGYVLGEHAVSLRIADSEVEGFGFFHCEFDGGQWIRVRLGQVDFSHTVFRSVFFEDVDFSQGSFVSVRFERCTFLRCRFPTEALIENVERVGCHTLILESAPVSQAPTEPDPAVAAVAPVSAVPKPVGDSRFDRIER